MMESSARMRLPLLVAGQAQKEITHNEALALIDLAVQPSVVEIGRNAPPAAPAHGEAWVVGAAPEGAWADHAGALAGWTAGGWRFMLPWVGFAVWNRADRGTARFDGEEWRRTAPASAIDAPAGGGVIDAEARAAIGSMLASMRAHGWIKG
ncbi:DUF2793 domain-containing protein [uncultured Sphingomonas sp.]|uniref:DUF2793 domain-containing protein n=1 Tax=uncultured Sphingomonas sp. TaxID=158754 RepID=UPI00260508B1|nr:DUF2793 domain-containing protein [uncultured Sphingomonas sp.]